FSAGMRQRLALARVLQQEARIALLDEPYGHLDAVGCQFVDRVLQGLRARGATVLMATHLLQRGRALCDRALVLEEGRLVFAGAAADLPEPTGAAAAAAEAECGTCSWPCARTFCSSGGAGRSWGGSSPAARAPALSSASHTGAPPSPCR